MVGGHHQLNRHEFEQTPGDSEGQGVLQSMRWQSVGHELVTEQQQNEMQLYLYKYYELDIKEKKKNLCKIQ